jgi:L-Ala-D/L-Glu epimerase
MSEQVTISQVEIYKMRVPLKEPFVTSLGKEESADNVVIVIRTSNGITGFGECNPFMQINGESIDTCFIVAQYLAKVLKGKSPLKLDNCLAAMDKVIYGNHSIKSAFDIALHDIIGQNKNVPIYKLFGGKNDKKLYTDYTVSVGEPEKMAEDALKIKQAGFPAIKVKLGQSRKKDIKRIKLIRDAVGFDIPIRIDANQGWKVKTAIEALNALDAYSIEFCEEPIARWNYMRLRKVKHNSPIPIMADESVSDHHDAERLIKMRACDMINIKVGKAGGLLNAWKIVKLAEQRDVQLQIGAFMESRLAMTASAHLALCSPNILYTDFDTPLMHAEDYVIGGLTYHEKGLMKVPDTPGLGASIEQSVLDKWEKIII